MWNFHYEDIHSRPSEIEHRTRAMGRVVIKSERSEVVAAFSGEAVRIELSAKTNAELKCASLV